MPFWGDMLVPWRVNHPLQKIHDGFPFGRFERYILTYMNECCWFVRVWFHVGWNIPGNVPWESLWFGRNFGASNSSLQGLTASSSPFISRSQKHVGTPFMTTKVFVLVQVQQFWSHHDTWRFTKSHGKPGAALVPRGSLGQQRNDQFIMCCWYRCRFPPKKTKGKGISKKSIIICAGV